MQLIDSKLVQLGLVSQLIPGQRSTKVICMTTTESPTGMIGLMRQMKKAGNQSLKLGDITTATTLTSNNEGPKTLKLKQSAKAKVLDIQESKRL